MDKSIKITYHNFISFLCHILISSHYELNKKLSKNREALRFLVILIFYNWLLITHLNTSIHETLVGVQNYISKHKELTEYKILWRKLSCYKHLYSVHFQLKLVYFILNHIYFPLLMFPLLNQFYKHSLKVSLSIYI